MDPRLESLRAEAPDLIAGADTLEELDAVEQRVVGRSSPIAEIRRGLGQLPPDERPIVGRAVKDVADEVTAWVERRRSVLEEAAEASLLEADRVDLTVPMDERATGTHHLITSTIAEIVDIFTGLGYRVADGPEVETGWYNFDALNTPPDHPARAESDTLYVDFGLSLIHI